MSGAFVLGDWGTSHLRLYLFEKGEIRARLHGPGTGTPGNDAGSILAERLALWQNDCTIADVTLCGMAGAPGGLVQAGYVPCPADPVGWLAGRACTRIGGVPVAVMPGLSHRTPAGVPEIMRGEETQIFGAIALDPSLAAGTHQLVLPGTHSKWVSLSDGVITGFHTCPTGEIFALLTERSTLTGPDTPGRGSFDKGFARGMERANEPLTAALFESRAARMLDTMSRNWSHGFISGLLIGGEVKTQATPGRPITLIGDPTLSGLYEKALDAIGCKARRVDGDAAVIAGLGLTREKCA